MIRFLVIPAFVITTQTISATANELDRDLPSNSFSLQRKAELSRDLPQTIIVRTNEKTKQVEVAFLKDAIPANKVAATKADFQKFAMNQEVRGLPYNIRNELDVTTSTASWGWGWRGGGWWGWGRGWWGPRFSVGIGFPGWGFSYGGYPWGCAPYAGWYSRPWGYAVFRPF